MLLRKHEGKRTLGRCSHRWEDTIKISVKEEGCVDVGGIDLSGPGLGPVLLRSW